MKKGWHMVTSRGFTVVELLVVIVVIGVLAVVSIIGYNGVQSNARRSATLQEINHKVDAIKAASLRAGFPESLASVSIPASEGDVSFSYSRIDNGRDFCLTALYKNEFAFHRGEAGAPEEGPCDGHSGGTSYCPTDTYVPINGFYCLGNVGAAPTHTSGLIKLESSTAPIPAGAPGAYVARQKSRDTYGSASFAVTPGERFCMEGWVTTVDSAVTHAIGMMVTNSSGTNSWIAFGRATPAQATGSWVKLSGCYTVPAGMVTGRVWNQNDGSNGSNADPAWYQTAIRFWKE